MATINMKVPFLTVRLPPSVIAASTVCRRLSADGKLLDEAGNSAAPNSNEFNACVERVRPHLEAGMTEDEAYLKEAEHSLAGKSTLYLMIGAVGAVAILGAALWFTRK
jgi:hypothetical protein